MKLDEALAEADRQLRVVFQEVALRTARLIRDHRLDAVEARAIAEQNADEMVKARDEVHRHVRAMYAEGSHAN